MFGSNTLSLPTSFAHEHPSLRMSSEAVRPQPVGQCHFQLLHPAAENQICACQVYQHNRGAPGNVCDCGHSACYHGATATEMSPVRAQSPTIDLACKIKKLEDMVFKERELRNHAIAQERAIWEREIRILREALAPFYRSEEDMQRKLEELDNKVDGSLEQQARIHERLMAIRNNDIAMDKQRVGLNLDARHANIIRQRAQSPPTTSVNNSDDVPGLTSSDERSSLSSSSFSRHQTPIDAITTATDPESPRSSGILNLINYPRPTVPPYVMPRHASISTMSEEPRSSGFLGVDLREHHKTRMVRKTKTGALTTTVRYETPLSLPRPSPPVNSDHTCHGVKRRKRQGNSLMALDVLADVSATRG